jgi:hypothetical protein
VPDLAEVPRSPSIDAEMAAAAMRGVLAKHFGITDAELSAPRLEIFNRSLFDGGPFKQSRLAWFAEASTFDRLEYIWIDAVDGSLLLNFNQQPNARNRLIYDAENTNAIPGTLVRSEGEGDTLDPDADNAYLYSGDTYDYFWTNHGRDSFDGAGATMVSTVHYCDENPDTPGTYDCPMVNAFWSGRLQQMVYGEGFASADDVVAHELTHAVTSYTAGLYYYMQSGALNESFSDIFGETVDLTNGHGDDDPGKRWLVGEDLFAGGFRDMWEPNNGAQPERMSDSTYFYCALGDNGGVHYNSGVPNHAYALMVDGGGYNGYTISGIGLEKAAAIHYRVLTEYLVSGSDFADFYNATNQACSDLIGTDGITSGDCAEVNEALLAVELDDPWPCLPAQSSEPTMCEPGETVSDLFFADFVSSPDPDWSVVSSDGFNVWSWVAGFSPSDTPLLYGPDASSAAEVDLRANSDLAVPTGGAKLRINHAFGFEAGAGLFYDGGFIILSDDSGSTWDVADCSSCGGLGYGGTIATGLGSSMAGHDGFVDTSFGFATTQLDLAAYAGQSIRVGFRTSSDDSVGDFGWLLDDVRIFTCVPPPTEIFDDDFESGDFQEWSSKVP